MPPGGGQLPLVLGNPHHGSLPGNGTGTWPPRQTARPERGGTSARRHAGSLPHQEGLLPPTSMGPESRICTWNLRIFEILATK